MKQKTIGYMVFYKSEDGLINFPMGADPSCAGAIQSDDSAPVLFPSRQDARKAIRISAANARLLREQGEPENTDFTVDIGLIKVVPVKMALASKK